MPIPGAMVLVKGNWLFCSAMVRCFYGGCASTLDKRVLTLTHHMGE